MMPLAIIGVLIIASIVGYGVWRLANSFTLKQTTERYRYEKTIDKDGNEITKVVDLQDEDNK